MTKTMANRETRVDTKPRTHAVAFIATHLFDSMTRSALALENMIVARRRENHGDARVMLDLWPLHPCPGTESFVILLMPESLLDELNSDVLNRRKCGL